MSDGRDPARAAADAASGASDPARAAPEAASAERDAASVRPDPARAAPDPASAEPDAATPRDLADPAGFLSGESGHVAGVRRVATRTVGDAALDAVARLGGTQRRLDRLADAAPARRVLLLSVYRPGSRLAAALPHLRSTRHRVELVLGALGALDAALSGATALHGLSGGKFQNLNRLLDACDGPAGFDWVVVVDDDVRLPSRFLDRMLGVCERLALDLAQPAQTLRSHAAWRVTRRRPAALARRTRFVEIGPVTAFGRRAAAELMPFPDLRFGWGLDLHWAALAESRGWRLGVVDALPVRHQDAPAAAAYGHAAAIEEASRFLAGRPYLPSARAGDTLATHRRLAA